MTNLESANAIIASQNLRIRELERINLDQAGIILELKDFVRDYLAVGHTLLAERARKLLIEKG